MTHENVSRPENLLFAQCLRGSKTIYIAGLLHALWGALLALSPLAFVLDYESALATAVFHGFLMPGIWAALLDRTGNRALLFWPQWVAAGQALVAIPFAVLLVSTLLHCHGGIPDGMLFWLLYPVCTSLFVSTLVVALAPVRRRRWRIATAALLPWVFLFWSITRLYFHPPVFLYDPFFGFFSGAFYDRYIDIPDAFWAARAMHLAAALAALATAAVAWGELPRKTGLAVTGAAALLSLGLYTAGPALGMRFSHRQLQAEMGNRLDTPDFSIVYTDKTPENRVKLLAVEAQWHRTELARFFGTAPSRRTIIYLFADDDQKRYLFGTREVEVAKPWQHAVFIEENGFPHPSLRHELAHVYAAAWGDFLFGIAWTQMHIGPLTIPLPDPGTIEGVAVAADAEQEDTPIHADARLLYEMGGFSSFDMLFSPAFYGVSSARAYTQAGSFLRYVYETRGADPLRRLFREGGPPGRIWPDLPELQAQYLRFLETVPVPEHQAVLSRERFLLPPIHRQRCVHAVARARRNASVCAENKNLSCAVDALNAAHRLDPDNLETSLLELGILRRLSGAAGAARAADRVLELSGPAVHLQVRAHLVKAEAAWMENDLQQARTHLQAAASVPLPLAVQREIKLMQTWLEHPEFVDVFKVPATQPMPAHLAAWYLETTAGPLPRGLKTLSLYLAAGLKLSAGRWLDASDTLENLDVSLLPDDNFRCEALFRRFLAAFLGRRFERADAALADYERCPVQDHNPAYYRKFLAFAAHSDLSWDPQNPGLFWH